MRVTILRVTILGKRWRLLFKRMKGHGLCHHPEKPFKEIHINSSLRGRDCLEAITHEYLHATAHDLLSEEWVEEAAHDLARILWRLGYRREKENGSNKSLD